MNLDNIDAGVTQKGDNELKHKIYKNTNRQYYCASTQEGKKECM